MNKMPFRKQFERSVYFAARSASDTVTDIIHSEDGCRFWGSNNNTVTKYFAASEEWSFITEFT